MHDRQCEFKGGAGYMIFHRACPASLCHARAILIAQGCHRQAISQKSHSVPSIPFKEVQRSFTAFMSYCMSYFGP